MGPGSCIDAFYRIAGVHEPAEGSLRVQSAKLWVRTVASLYHASMALPRGAGLLWADFDAVVMRPLDAPFWKFVRRHDVTYAPVCASSQEEIADTRPVLCTPMCNLIRHHAIIPTATAPYL